MRKVIGVLMLVLGMILLIGTGLMAGGGTMQEAVSGQQGGAFVGLLALQALCGLLVLGGGYGILRRKHPGLVVWGGLAAIITGALSLRTSIGSAVVLIIIGVLALTTREKPRDQSADMQDS